MKLTFILLVWGLMSFASATYSQNTKLTFESKDVTIEHVFKQIESLSEFKFAYNSSRLDIGKKISVKADNETIDAILNRILESTSFKYKIVDRYIIITDENVSSPIIVGSEQARKTVTGKVTDASGALLPGVSVVVKGTTTGVITDVDGKYSLSNIPENATLQFSFVGMKSKETAVGGKTNINVILEDETIGVEDVVVIGYGVQKKRDISSAISSVSSEDMKGQQVSNFAQAITGKMAGVRISNTNSAPGGGSNIVIRGVNSINASNDPLIVIDGFPLKDGFDQYENPLNSINPSDIESVEVLKDASSSAIYGARASNGVILITTKKGKLGKPTINVNINSGYEQIIHKMDVLNREDFLQFMDDSRAQAYIVEDPNLGTNNPSAPLWKWTDDNATRLYNWTNFSSMAAPMKLGNSLYYRWAIVGDETKAQNYNTDWQDVCTKIGKVQNFQLSATGGTENLKYMVSCGYYDQTGIVQASGYNRFSLRANVELKINDWLKTGLLLAPSLEDLDVMYNMESQFYNMVGMPPLTKPYDKSGFPEYTGQPLVSGGVDWKEWNIGYLVNPLAASLVKDNRRNFKNLSTIFGEISFSRDFVFRSEFHAEFRNWERNYFLPSIYPTVSITTSRTQGLNNITTRLFWNSQNYLTYNHKFGKHAVNAVLGYSAEKSTNRETYILKYDYPTDQVPTLNQAITILNVQSDTRTNRFSESMIGSFARAMYNYGEKYYLTASVRRDGSSKFGTNKKWGIFPSFSAAWRISDESFFSSSQLKNYIDDVKIRAGYGVIGNSGIGNYNALSTLSATSSNLGSGSAVSAGYVDGRVANSNLGWESTTDRGIGADFTLLKNRISFSIDYFHKLTENMLFSMPLPIITGFSSYMSNIGSMRNRGFEYLLTTRNFVGDFNWSTSINLSYYKNKVLNTGKDKRPLISNNSYTVENKPLAGLWGTYFLGPYQDWEDVKTNPIVNASNPKWMYRSIPGTSKLYDVNGDGIIDGNDNTIIGSPNPDFIWGMTNTFGYKGFDLSIQVNGVKGGEHMMTQMEGLMARNAGNLNTVYDYYNNYWRPDRIDAKYAAPNRKSWDGTSNRGTLVFEGTYANFQNITIGYSFPKTILLRMKMNQIRIYTSIQNALLITKYPGYNPEVNSSGNSALSQGVDAGAYPLTRTISFGINVSL